MAITLDGSLNSDEAVVKTVFSLFVTAALRTHSYVMQLRAHGQCATDLTYLRRSVSEAVIFGARLIHSRTLKRSSASGQSRTSLRGSDFGVDYGFAAFEADPPQPGSFDTLTSSLVYSHPPALPPLWAAVPATSRASSFAAQSVRHFAKCRLTVPECRWLGLSAFLVVFTERPAMYTTIMKRLACERRQLGMSVSTRMGDFDLSLNITAKRLLREAPEF